MAANSGTPQDEASPGLRFRHKLTGHSDIVQRLAWSPDGSRLASSSLDGTIRFWDIEGRTLGALRSAAELYTTAWAPSGESLAAVDEAGVRIWKVDTRHPASSFLHLAGVLSLAWSPDGHTLACGDLDGKIHLWRPQNGEWYARPSIDPPASVSGLAWSPAGTQLAAANDIGAITVWRCDGQTATRSTSLEGTIQHSNDVAWSPDGTRLVAAMASGHVGVWDITTGAQVTILEGHTSPVCRLAFSSDGRLVASTDASSTLRLWRCDEWREVGQLERTRKIGRLTTSGGPAFHPSSPLLATLADDRTTIELWDVDFPTLLHSRAPAPPKYTSAKIVLVGESEAGKSCLAMRLAENRYPTDAEQNTTHGLKFWPVEPHVLTPGAIVPEGERRDIVLWDMGGQHEYRLVHQLFLHDTTIALVLFDPRRGQTALDEVRAWNKRLVKQLQERSAIKLLVGAKIDVSSDLIDRRGIDKLVQDCGFAAYIEVSARKENNPGIARLRTAIGDALDWESLAKTARPELFQRIREEIEICRQNGIVVLSWKELQERLVNDFPVGDDQGAVAQVTEQLARQGVIALTQLASGESMVVLQIGDIERYAGSLIIAARANPTDVPAIELRTLTSSSLHLPGIPHGERLEREQELVVLECVVQLLIEHGICFQHQGLLIFPTLFRPSESGPPLRISDTVSLYYDFSGAIDNIYASLVAWLVIGKTFGQVRLWQDRAEFGAASRTCGLQKVDRGSGFAHLDVFFGSAATPAVREQFSGFVEEHLREHGIEIVEHVLLKCPECEHVFDEPTIRERISQARHDIGCPRCDHRVSLTDRTTTDKSRGTELTRSIWALRTRIDTLRGKMVSSVANVFAIPSEASTADDIKILHLSDLHFTRGTRVPAGLQRLTEDLKSQNGLNTNRLDYLVISGDFTHKGDPGGFELAYEFVSELVAQFGLSAERCIFVPGNHDLQLDDSNYTWAENADGIDPAKAVKQGGIWLIRNDDDYPRRLEAFSEGFVHKFLQRPYPLPYAAQGIPYLFAESSLQFLTLNSCWQIDKFHRSRSGVHEDAVAHLLKESRKQVDDAVARGQLSNDAKLHRIAVWHHAITGPHLMNGTDFVGLLRNAGVSLVLHGDVHETRRDLVGYWHPQHLHVVGAGSFGSDAAGRPESTPRLYNLIEIKSKAHLARVHTRCQPHREGPWQGWNEWPRPDGEPGAIPYYDIDLAPTPR